MKKNYKNSSIKILLTSLLFCITFTCFNVKAMENNNKKERHQFSQWPNIDSNNIDNNNNKEFKIDKEQNKNNFNNINNLTNTIKIQNTNEQEVKEQKFSSYKINQNNNNIKQSQNDIINTINKCYAKAKKLFEMGCFTLALNLIEETQNTLYILDNVQLDKNIEKEIIKKIEILKGEIINKLNNGNEEIKEKLKNYYKEGISCENLSNLKSVINEVIFIKKLYEGKLNEQNKERLDEILENLNKKMNELKREEKIKNLYKIIDKIQTAINSCDNLDFIKENIDKIISELKSQEGYLNESDKEKLRETIKDLNKKIKELEKREKIKILYELINEAQITISSCNNLDVIKENIEKVISELKSQEKYLNESETKEIEIKINELNRLFEEKKKDKVKEIMEEINENYEEAIHYNNNGDFDYAKSIFEHIIWNKNFYAPYLNEYMEEINKKIEDIKIKKNIIVIIKLLENYYKEIPLLIESGVESLELGPLSTALEKIYEMDKLITKYDEILNIYIKDECKRKMEEFKETINIKAEEIRKKIQRN